MLIDFLALYCYWQRRGVPLLFCDFVSMVKASAFSSHFSEEEVRPLSKFRPLGIEKFHQKISAAIHSSDLRSLEGIARSLHTSLLNPSCLKAMSRNMVETLTRCAVLTPWYEEIAQRKKVRSPIPPMKGYLRAHLKALYGYRFLDSLAAPLQAEGHPILLRDVPPIEICRESLRRILEESIQLFEEHA